MCIYKVGDITHEEKDGLLVDRMRTNVMEHRKVSWGNDNPHVVVETTKSGFVWSYLREARTGSKSVNNCL